MKPRIAILTNFSGSDSAFSLVNVVATQLKMLLDAEYDPTLIVTEDFTAFTDFWNGSRFRVVKCGLHSDKSNTLIDKLRPAIANIDIVICHDLVFLGQNKNYADAIRKLAHELKHTAWLHWQHSRGGHSPIKPVERSWYCYPNSGDLKHVATINSTDLDHVCYVPHPLDFDYLCWPALAIRIAEETEFPFRDISTLYPSRLDRGKQLDKLIRLYAGLKLAGKSVSLLVADAFCTGEPFLSYKREMHHLARELKLDKDEVIFLSEHYEECKVATPRQVVKALFEMSNLFVQPSNAETSSLVAMEAALAGNLLVINSDFSPIRHLYAKALSLPFGSVLEDTKYYRTFKTADGVDHKVDDPQQFFTDQARVTVIPALDSQLTLLVKRQQLRDRWPSRVFKEYMQLIIDMAFESVSGKVLSLSDPIGDAEITAIVTTMDNQPMLAKQVPILLQECGQVIVVNNGSLDNTADWLEETYQDNPRVRWINRENLGAGPGRNAGLNMWNNATPYTLMVDGGILPPIGGVKELKKYLERYLEVHVISPEVASCFTSDESKATRIAQELPEELSTFWQRCLSSTAYCMCRASAWDGLRFSEEGPFGEPGWGADDNDMAYRWNDHEPPIVHHDFTNQASGWMLQRRTSGSFERLYRETGIWPNQFGSVYEKRVVSLYQNWRRYHFGIYGGEGSAIPTASYVIRDVLMPDFAKLVKKLHELDKYAEVIVESNYDPDVTWWLDTFALRWPWSDTTIDPSGKILKRNVGYPEELWSGNVIRNRGPQTEPVIIMPDTAGDYLE